METPRLIVSSFEIVAPALALLIAGCGVLIFGLFRPAPEGSSSTQSSDGWAWTGLAIILLVWGAWWLSGESTRVVTSRLFQADSLSTHGTHLTLLGGAIIAAIAIYLTPRQFASEFHGCLLILLSGLAFVATAADLTTLYIGLEMVSIPTTVLLAISRRDDKGREATLKYFALSAFSSGIFLMGASFLYGIAGTTQISVIVDAISRNPSALVQVALALVLSGLAFRITAVPFHFYAPDVFSGSSLTVASLLAFLPKVAGFLAIARLLGGHALSSALAEPVLPILLALGVVTMTLGNALALVQTSWRRLLAYSSVAHTGYLLVGLAALLYQGISPQPVFAYLAAYAAMTLGVFAGLAAVLKSADEDIQVDALKGLYYRHAGLAAGLTLALLSLIGMPLTAGFWAKLQLIMAAVATNHRGLQIAAIIMAVNAAIAAIYYFNAIAQLYATSDAKSSESKSPEWNPAAVACVACAGVTLFWFFAPSWM